MLNVHPAAIVHIPILQCPTCRPKRRQKLEKTIQKEAKAEEKNVQHALKDLKSAEKSDTSFQGQHLLSVDGLYAYIVVICRPFDKAEKSLGKTQKKEESTLAAANKAAHKHDIAATDLNKADKDLKVCYFFSHR